MLSGNAARDAALLAAAFSRSVYRALGAREINRPPSALSLVSDLGAASGATCLADSFDRALRLSARHYRSEYYYKNAIVNRIIFGRHSPRTAAPLIELRARGSIADVTVFNGTSTAYEIKTDYDDYARLATQLGDYTRCFEHVYVVVSPRRVEAALAAVPPHVGVISVNRRGSMSEHRGSKPDPARLDQGALFGLLHRAEVLRVLARTMGYAVDAPPGHLWARTRALFIGLPVEVAHAEVVTELRARGRLSATMASTVPPSLRAMAYDVPVNPAEAHRITRRLAQPAGAPLV